MSNLITIEFSPEDRARLDKIISLLSAAGTPYDNPQTFTGIPVSYNEAEPEVQEATNSEETKEPGPERSVTFEKIQQRVVQLCAADAGKLKAKVREIINEYGAKVSDLKTQPEKWSEVFDRLNAMGQGG